MLQEWGGLTLNGDHSGWLDDQNTFTLDTPHEVMLGIGISVFFQSLFIGDDTSIKPAQLVVSSAGGDFVV